MTSPSASEEAAPEKNPAAHVPCDAELKENEESLALKGQGNEAYRAGDFRKALELFSAAIAIDKANAILFTNRAMCHGALKDWARCLCDAKQALQLSPKHAKAHFW